MRQMFFYLVILIISNNLFASGTVFSYYGEGELQTLKQIEHMAMISGSRTALKSLDYRSYHTVFERPGLRAVSFDDSKLNNTWENIKKHFEEKGLTVLPVVTWSGTPVFLTGKIGLKWKPHMKTEEIAKVIKQYDLVPERQDSYSRDAVLYYNPRQGGDVFEISRTLYKKGYVEWAQPSWYEKAVLHSNYPNDPFYGDQWYQSTIKADAAWEYSKGTKSTVIAIVDSGLQTSHPDINGNFIVGRDFSDEENPDDPNPEADLYSSTDHVNAAHGTGVAGIAAASGNNGEGIAGVCPECGIMAIKLISIHDMYINIERSMVAVKWAVDNGAAVINNSWGAQDTDVSGDCIDVPLDNYRTEAIRYAKKYGREGKGAIVTWASGNSGCDTDKNANFVNNDILIIGSHESNGRISYYSNYGNAIDIAAPSANLTTDLMGESGFNSTVYDYGEAWDDNYTSNFAGTSAAAPVVAGVAGLLISYKPHLKFKQIMTCIKMSLDQPDSSCRHGDFVEQTTFDPYLSGEKLHSPCFGYGTLNLETLFQYAENGICEAIASECEDDRECEDGYFCNYSTGMCEKSDEENQNSGNSNGCGCTVISF